MQRRKRRQNEKKQGCVVGRRRATLEWLARESLPEEWYLGGDLGGDMDPDRWRADGERCQEEGCSCSDHKLLSTSNCHYMRASSEDLVR